jgi:hypothetical protein
VTRSITSHLGAALIGYSVALAITGRGWHVGLAGYGLVIFGALLGFALAALDVSVRVSGVTGNESSTQAASSHDPADQGR